MLSMMVMAIDESLQHPYGPTLLHWDPMRCSTLAMPGSAMTMKNMEGKNTTFTF